MNMKKRIFVLGVFLILLLAVSAAQDVTISGISVIEEKPSLSFSRIFTVKNTGDENLTLNIQLDSTQLSGFNIKFDPSQLSLNTGAQTNIRINGTVPDNIETTRKDDNVIGTTFSGTIRVFSGSAEWTAPLSVVAESQLRFDNVKAKVDGKSKSIDPGDKIKDVKPGSKLTISGDIDNLYTDDEDIDIENIEMIITIKDIDDDDDLEEEEDIGDIDADDEESFSVDFEIPEEVEDDEYNVLIELEGEDENGATHKVEWELSLELEKEKHDIQITKVSLSPSKIDCSRNINLKVDLKNQGQNDEDEVVLEILNSDLDIDEEDTSIPEIEEGTGDDTEFGKTYTFTVDDKVRKGTYPITVKVYYDTDTLSDIKTTELVVENCEEEEEEAPIEEEEEEGEEVVVIMPEEEEEGEEEGLEPEIITTAATITTEASFLESKTFFYGLIAAVIIAALVVVILIVVLFSTRKRI